MSHRTLSTEDIAMFRSACEQEIERIYAILNECPNMYDANAYDPIVSAAEQTAIDCRASYQSSDTPCCDWEALVGARVTLEDHLPTMRLVRDAYCVWYDSDAYQQAEERRDAGIGTWSHS